MEKIIHKSEKTVKKYRDDWYDTEGRLHTRIVKEIISGPMNNVQASNLSNSNDLKLVPTRFLIRNPFPGIRNPFQRQVQPQPVGEPAQEQPVQKPIIDINSLIQIGKKLLDNEGEFKDMFDKYFRDSPLIPIEEKGVNETCQKKTKQLKQKKQLKNQKKTKKTQNKSK